MKLLPGNPRARQRVLFGVLAGAVLAGFSFFYIIYFVPAGAPPAAPSGSLGGQGVSESVIRRTEQDIAGLREELRHEFYASLRAFRWTPDKTAPGKKNPFVQ